MKVFGRTMGYLLLVGAICVWALTGSNHTRTNLQHLGNKSYNHAEVHKLAKHKGMAKVGALLAAKYEFVASPLGANLPLDANNDINNADIRKAVLLVANLHNDKDDLGRFAQTDNADKTCATFDTAGGFGLEVCVAQCDRKSGFFFGSKPSPGACYALCSLAVAPCYRSHHDTDWTTDGVGALTAAITRIPIKLLVHKTLAFVSTFPAVAAFVDGDHARVASIVLFLGVVGLAWRLVSTTRKARQEARDALRRAHNATEENAAMKLRNLLKIRKRVLLHGAFQQISLTGSWSIYHTMQKDTAEANKLAACKALGRLDFQHERRIKAVKFTKWEGVVVAFKAVDEALGRGRAPIAER